MEKTLNIHCPYLLQESDPIEPGRIALNGALAALGIVLAKNLSKKFEEVEVNDEVVVPREEYELTKKELDLAKRRKKLRYVM